MIWRVNRTFDRKPERDLFHRILYNEISLRGLIVHSNSEGGVGKSTLLKIFENECNNPLLPTPTRVIYFTADRLINWRTILDTTIEKLGAIHFSKYTQMRLASSVGDRKQGIDTYMSSQPVVIHIHGNIETSIGSVEGQVHSGSGSIGVMLSESIANQINSPQERRDTEITGLSAIEIRQKLTQTFMQELNALPYQVVWLIDATEKLDEESQSWLVELFWEVADQKIQRLILVAAGRERLRHQPQWSEYVEELMLRNFTEDDVLEILLEIWPTQQIVPYRGLASLLVEKGKGIPLEIMMQIENMVRTRGAVHG